MSHNPFIFGRVVSGSHFYGREAVLKKLQSHIESGQSVAVYGERRVGKTSLVMEALRSQEGFEVLHVDLFEIKTVDDIVSCFARSIKEIKTHQSPADRLVQFMKRIRGDISFGQDPVTGLPNISISPKVKDPVQSIADIFDYIERICKETPLVVFFDEFQSLLDLKDFESILAAIRSKIQHQVGIPYIFAGSIRRQMYRIFMDPRAPLYKSAMGMEIPPLPYQEIGPFLKQNFIDGERQINEVLLKNIYDSVHGVTGDVQQFCNAIWIVTQPGDQVTEQHLDLAIQEILQTEEPHYFDIIKPLTAIQYKVLKALAECDGQEVFGTAFREKTGGLSVPTIQRGIKRFEKNDIVYQPAGQKTYRFYMPFFRLWLIRQNALLLQTGEK